MKTLSGGLAVGAVVVVALAAGVYLGAYDVAADSPHWGLTSSAIEIVRDRSIGRRATGMTVPDLSDRDLIALGAEHYSEMCVGCHLAPGIENSEVRQGLNPMPPDLSRGSLLEPAEEFWVVKHGIKMSGMPAWGTSHGDEAIWGIVAFLQRLPNLDAREYAALTGAEGVATMDDATSDDHDHEHEHRHVHAGGEDQGH